MNTLKRKHKWKLQKVIHRRNSIPKMQYGKVAYKPKNHP